MRRLWFWVALGAVLMSSCVPGQGAPPDAAPPPPSTADAGDANAGSDPIALDLCLANYEQLNPELPASQVQAIFCNTPDDLAPWARQRLLKPNLRIKH